MAADIKSPTMSEWYWWQHNFERKAQMIANGAVPDVYVAASTPCDLVSRSNKPAQRAVWHG